MRKAIVLLLILGLVMGLVAAPALAGKKKKKTESWTATAPKPGVYQPGTSGDCNTSGVEGLDRVTHSFKTPGPGVLDVTMTGFLGDWDLYVTDADANVFGSSTGFVEATTERVVVPLKGNFEVLIMACNFVGGPTAELSLTYVYK